jgi:hypothetical protein
MKAYFLLITLCFILFPIFAQEHILIDCIHGANYSTSYDGPQPIDFQSIFPNDILTIITPDDVDGLITLEDAEINAGTHTFLFNLPTIGIPEEVQTIYVIAHDNTGNILNGIIGTITSPDNVLTTSLYNGSGHVDAAYGNGWTLQIQTSSVAHLYVGYGSTVFSGPAQNGHYNLNDYDAVLRIYDQFYVAYMTEAPDYSNADINAISNGLQNGLSFMHIFNYINTLVDKPFIHMYTSKNISASVNVSVPGTRTLALPKPDGDGQNFGWNNISLATNSMNEHVYETALNQKLNFVDFQMNGNDIGFTNQTDETLHDLTLLRSVSPQLYQIGKCDILLPGIKTRVSQWKTVTTNQARGLLEKDLYDQCLASGLTTQEAKHFAYELPWVDVLLLRAVRNPDQYFGLYHFDNQLYDRLLPVVVKPLPNRNERNMWVMLSNIQPRDTEPVTDLQPNHQSISKMNETADFLYREYGMVDERYSMKNSTRETGFMGIDVYSHNMFHSTLTFYTNLFATELAGFENNLVFPYWLTSFTVDNPEQYGIFYDIWDNLHPVSVAKPILAQGRVMVLGSSSQFVDTTQYAYLRSAMNSLIHSPNLITGNPDTPLPLPATVKISNYPNPFNPGTTIQYSIPMKGNVEINLYNIKGQLIKQLISANMEEGMHSMQWNGLNEDKEQVASQVILCRMQYRGHDYLKKIILMK